MVRSRVPSCPAAAMWVRTQSEVGMLKQEYNELLTRTGPGTPGGDFFRRFWLPALLYVPVDVGVREAMDAANPWTSDAPWADIQPVLDD